jgi:BolA protein
VHALSIEALTPEQWTARGGQTLPSPPCLGGSKG